MAETTDIVRWIRSLADHSPRIRAAAAEQLYRTGNDLCEAPLRQWTTDPEFRGLVCTRRAESAHADNESAVIVVGIAVHPDHFERIRAANGSPPLADVPPDQDAREFELHFENHAALDILTARDPGGAGAIARYLQKIGEGIQQVEIYVRDVDRATQILRARFGFKPVYPATRPGAGRTRVNFFLVPPSPSQKVLIELVESR
jgi:hypothetical protein